MYNIFQVFSLKVWIFDKDLKKAWKNVSVCVKLHWLAQVSQLCVCCQGDGGNCCLAEGSDILFHIDFSWAAPPKLLPLIKNGKHYVLKKYHTSEDTAEKTVWNLRVQGSSWSVQLSPESSNFFPSYMRAIGMNFPIFWCISYVYGVTTVGLSMSWRQYFVSFLRLLSTLLVPHSSSWHSIQYTLM